MEHFEVHKEWLEDVLIEIEKKGPSVIRELPPPLNENIPVTMDDIGLIDEISGLNDFLDNFMKTHNLSQVQRERIESRMVRYKGDKPKEVALNEMRMYLYGDTRWTNTKLYKSTKNFLNHYNFSLCVYKYIIYYEKSKIIIFKKLLYFYSAKYQ